MSSLRNVVKDIDTALRLGADDEVEQEGQE